MRGQIFLQVMRFMPYTGSCHLTHLAKKRIFPISDFMGNTSVDFKVLNTQVLAGRLCQQLPKLAAVRSQVLSGAVDVNVRFGRFYINDQASAMHRFGR